MSRADLLEVHAKEKAGLPDAWRASSWQCLPPGETIYYAIGGAVYPEKYKSGKRKGGINYGKPQEGTVRTVNIPVAEQEAWEREWERRTGNCAACAGSGKKIASASISKGATYRPCERCAGTGKAVTR